MYNIEISSLYEEFWRYNLLVMCVGYNDLDEQIFVESARDEIAQIGDDVNSKPSTYPSQRVLFLQLPPSHSLRLLVYVIPHALPVSSDVEFAKPFELSISVMKRGKAIYSSMQMIDQWSGASLNIAI